MRGPNQQLPAAAWALSAQQHGVIARYQLLELGFSPKAIDRRIASRRLHIVWRGVYAVGRPELSREGRLMAAVLACDRDAALSYESAAELWRMLPEQAGPVHVSLVAGYDRRLPGIVVHRRVAISRADVTTCRRIRVTSPACTIVDLACRLAPDALEAVINEADKRDLIGPDELRDALADACGRPGVAATRAILERRTFTFTDSELERRFLPLARAAGLSQPQTQSHVNGFRVDFYWPELGLVVETDGLRYHRTPAQQARDRVRDQAHAAAGLTPVRFTRAQVRFEPDYVRSILTAVKARLLN